jgi:hypothetical protein
LGLRVPDDYKQLLEHFPDGVFGGLVQFNRPGDYHHSPDDFLGYYAYQLDDMRRWRADGRGPFWQGSIPYPIFPEPGGLLPWGRGPRMVPFFWLTEPANDPNEWPIVVADHDFTDWHIFRYTTCELLLNVVENQVDLSFLGAPRSGSPFDPTEERRSGTSRTSAKGTGAYWKVAGNATIDMGTLIELTGAPTVRPSSVDWEPVEREIGVRLPSDYKGFVDSYGPGTYGDVTITAPGGPAEWDFFGLIDRHRRRMKKDSRFAMNPVLREVPVFPESAGIIPWGEAPDEWTFCWAPTGGDPDRWGTVLINPTEMLTYLPSISFSSFLRDFARQDEEIGILLGRDRTPDRPHFVPAPTLPDR